MKVSSKNRSGLLAVALAALVLLPPPGIAAPADDYRLLLRYFREKNYAMVKNLAKDLADSREFRYPVRLLLAEVYFQENDLYYAEYLLSELLREFPEQRMQIEQRLEKVGREREFLSRGGREQEKRVQIFWGGTGAADEGLVKSVSDAFDDAWRDGGRYLGWYPDESVKVFVYTGGDYGKYTIMPPWSEGGYDGKIRVMVQRNLPASRLREIIYHEYAHVIVTGITRGNCPLWLNEAVAQYFSIKFGSRRTPSTKPPAMKPADFPKSWSGEPEDRVRTLYEESLNLLALIVRKSDESVVVTMLENLGKGMTFGRALDDALSIYGLRSADIFP